MERTRKRPRLTSKNGRRDREVFGDAPVKEMKIPAATDDYYFHMGAVDIVAI